MKQYMYPGVTADLQYTVNNLVPETLYIFQIITRNYYGDAFTKSVNCTTDHSMYDVVYILMENRNCALLGSVGWSTMNFRFIGSKIVFLSTISFAITKLKAY
jgi:hypothetical protein